MLPEERHLAFAAEDELFRRLTASNTFILFVIFNLANVLEDLSAVGRPNTPTNLHDLLLRRRSVTCRGLLLQR